MGYSDSPPKWVEDGFFKPLRFTPDVRAKAVWEEVDDAIPSHVRFPVAQQWRVSIGSMEWRVFMGYKKECEYIMEQ